MFLIFKRKKRNNQTQEFSNHVPWNTRFPYKVGDHKTYHSNKDSFEKKGSSFINNVGTTDS